MRMPPPSLPFNRRAILPVILAFPTCYFVIFSIMAPKENFVETYQNPLVPPACDLDHIPMADKDYKFAKPKCEFDFFELHYWMKDIFLYQSDEIGLWESNLPLYMFPQTHPLPKFILKCQAIYLPNQRAIASPTGEIMFTITPDTIDRIL
jgi:hypothetical protein